MGRTQAFAVLPQLVAHEVRSLFRTRRVLVLLGLYLAAGSLTGLAYVMTLRGARQTALDRAQQEGISQAQAQQLIDESASPIADKLLEGAAGSDLALIAQSLTTSTVLTVFFWASLSFLPFLILMSSFDMVASELANKSLRYSVLRVSRFELLLGKTAAHLLVFAGVSAVAALSLMGMAAGFVEGFSIADNLVGFARVWWLLLPFAACYVGIATFASCTTPHGIFALMLSLVIAVGLRLVGWIAGFVDETGSAAPLRALQYVSPGHYHDGLWLADWTGPLASSAAYLGFAGLFGALAYAVLQRRDL